MRVAIDARKAADFGIGTYIRGLVSGMARVDPDLEIVLIGDPAAFPDAPAGAAWVHSRASHYGVRELFTIGRVAAAARADVFHAPHYVYPLHLPCPGVVTIHDCIHLRFPEYLPRPLGILPRASARAYARWMIRHAGRRAAEVITVSEASRDDLRSLAGITGKRIHVIPNGVTRDGPPADAAARRARLGIANDPYLLFVGNDKPHKNLALLIDAFASVVEDVPALGLVIAGRPGASVEDLQIWPPTARARVTVVVEPPEDDLWSLYGGALAVCVPSRFEGFGLVALEGMRAGVPVLAAVAGALPEVVGDAGVLVPTAHVESWAGAIRRLAADASLREQLGARGRVRAAAFTWERAAADTLQVYRMASERRA